VCERGKFSTPRLSIISRCEDRHRHQEWLKFLRVIDYVIPAGKQVHLIVDNYATHKHPKSHKVVRARRFLNVRVLKIPFFEVTPNALRPRCCPVTIRQPGRVSLPEMER
jgi:hypothetical protein